MSDEIDPNDLPQTQPAEPEVVQAQPIKRRGRPPKAASLAQPAQEPQAAPAQEKQTKKLIVVTRFPYAMHCSTQNIMINPDSPTEVEPDFWIQSQIDAGLLKVLT